MKVAMKTSPFTLTRVGQAWLFAMRVTEATVDATKHSLEPESCHLQRTADVAHVSIVEAVVDLCLNVLVSDLQ